ncbi:MAG: M6 family metalloprotease domain-containing protein [Prevotella sp.]|nr:M6 family metalloprotease domain-containing protein [Prevotella sp.]
MQHIRHILALSVVLCFCVGMQAVKVDPRPATVTQADGSRLVVIGHGDADCHWYETTDGVLLFHEGAFFYVAQTDDEGNLKNSHILAHEKGLRTAEEIKAIQRQDIQAFLSTPLSTGKDRLKEPVKENSTYFPHTGSPRAIVILAQFQDSVFMDDDPKTVFQEYLNAEVIDKTVGNQTVGRNYGSVRNYFDKMSNGTFLPQFDIYGPVTLPGPLKDYGAGNDNMGSFIPDVCELAHQQGLDFSQYDANDDGYVDLVYIIYAGYAESITGNTTECIWPRSGTIAGGRYDGKIVLRFGVHAERNGTPTSWDVPRISGIGLFCHEFSHTMGLPDFYPTNKAAQKAGNPAMEYWDVMDGGEYVSNGYYPTEYTAWEREALGWMTIETLTESGDYQMAPLGSEGGKAFRIPNPADPTGNEYLLLQNIQAKGFNRALGRVLGHGMLMTHVDYDKEAFTLESNSVNNTVGHSRMTIIPADGEYISSYSVDNETITNEMYMASHGGDPFPGTTQTTEISDIVLYNGEFTAAITNIAEDEESGIVSFTYTTEQSAIKAVEADAAKILWHNLSGQRIDAPSKGIFIHNGKKVVLK